MGEGGKSRVRRRERSLLPALLFISASMSGLALPAGARPIGFAERVEAQAAIERVYHRHRTGASLPFEDALPEAVLRERVRDYLARSAALGEFWDTPVTAEMLQREVERMARSTALPERLDELFAALGRDPVLVRECLARRSLVERLTRVFFATDRRIHGTARREAEAIRQRLVNGELDPARPAPGRIQRWSLREETPQDDPARHRGGDRVEALDPEAFAELRARLPSRVGDVGPVTESSSSFEVVVLLDDEADAITVAGYRVAKTTWEEWWDSARMTLDGDDGPAPGKLVATLPAVKGREAASADCASVNTWDPGSLDDAPLPRYGHTAVWTGSEMIIWGAGIEGGRYDPLTAVWTPLSPVGAPASRRYQTAVWTGSEMIVWGGLKSGEGVLQTGAGYDPVADKWTPLPVSGAPTARYRHHAFWTGDRMLVWGGAESTGRYTNTGGLYDPVAESWSELSTVGAPTRYAESTAWTGTDLVVWGGVDGLRTNSGAWYSLATDSWTDMTTAGAPSARENASAIWTGTELVVWGGYNGGATLATGGRYDPGTDSWVDTPVAPMASARHAAVWTGGEMLVWGPYAHVRYDPVSEQWTPMATLNAPSESHFRYDFSTIWTGSQMIVWGGWESIDPFYATNSGAAYNPDADRWTPTGGGMPTGRENHTAVWTGSEMIVWGGEERGTPLGLARTDGGRYDPATDSWTATARAGAPATRARHTAVWAGDFMIVWGGRVSTVDELETASGGRYDPTRDFWGPTALDGAPAARMDHTAVWTGDEMIVWGGVAYPPGTLATGGRYDPLANAWEPTPTDGAPGPRVAHSAVWTGDEMIVWGGVVANVRTATGGRLDPWAGSWTATPLEDAPAPREGHSAVWTGQEMIVWGGQNEGGYLDSGGRYSPAAGTWFPTALADAPAPRRDHTAVWTGREVLIWGDFTFDPGRRYDPLHDSWKPMPTLGGPPPRQGHSTVWADPLMIVWGGWCCGGYGMNGSRYVADTSADQDGDGWTVCDGDCDDELSVVFPGAAEVCDGLDSDCNGVVDDAPMDADGDGFPVCFDCDDGDPASFAWPAEVKGAIFTDGGGRLTWEPVAPPHGGEIRYDVLRGGLDSLPVWAGSEASCDAHGIATTSMENDVWPAPGTGIWYLIRAREACLGTYGHSSAGAPRESMACPWP